jgi:hypothetical protein
MNIKFHHFPLKKQYITNLGSGWQNAIHLRKEAYWVLPWKSNYLCFFLVYLPGIDLQMWKYIFSNVNTSKNTHLRRMEKSHKPAPETEELCGQV